MSATEAEQQYWLQRIIDLLLAAGYFRAGVQSLDPFDKVVGGLVWCLQVSAAVLPQHHVDMSLRYKESASIGQKIKVGEVVTKALVAVGMPHRIETHQIQGKDYKNLFPVFQWIITFALKSRHVTQHLHDQLAQRHNTLLENPCIDEAQCPLFTTCRLFRRKPEAQRRPLKESVALTLLEYGEDHDVFQTADGTSSRRLSRSGLQTAGPAVISKGQAANLLGSERDKIRKLNKEFHELVQDEDAMRLKHHQETVSRLEYHIVALREELVQVDGRMEALEEAIQNAVQALQQLDAELEQLYAQEASLDQAMEKQKRNADGSELQALLKEHEDRKAEIRVFKEMCRSELSRLQKDVEKEPRQVTDDTEIDQLLERESKQHQTMREALAAKTLEISRLQRKLDEIPTNAELLQYEKRFRELHELVSTRLRETKMYYDKYNTLETTYRFLKNEVSLLKSIQEQFPAATKSPGACRSFIQQMDHIMVELDRSSSKVERDWDNAQANLAKHNATLHSLLDTQRQYFDTVQLYRETCLRRESLAPE